MAITFKLFDFEVLQLRYVKAAADEIPSFRPDEKAPADIQAMRDLAEAVKTAYKSAEQTLNLADGELDEAQEAAHVLCIQVYAIMKSRFRKDPGSLQAINRLPVQDKTLRETRDRMEAISLLWGKLPNPPGSPNPFNAWDTMGKTEFDAVLASLKTKDEAQPGIVQDLENAQGTFQATLDTVEEFVTAALTQGRNQFAEGTAEREIIDAIPMEPAQSIPLQAVISQATSPAAGQVSLTYGATNATMFDIYQKGPADADFVKIVNDAITKTYSASGLSAGDYQYKVVGENSQGTGAESDVATVTVAPLAPSQPTGLTLDVGPQNAVTASWNPTPGADSYKVFKQEVGSDPDFLLAGTTTDTSLLVASPSSGTTVRVKVRAVAGTGQNQAEGPDSAVVEITVP